MPSLSTTFLYMVQQKLEFLTSTSMHIHTEHSFIFVKKFNISWRSLNFILGT